MAEFTELTFPVRWARKSADDTQSTLFPSYESSEDQARADLQRLFDDIVRYLSGSYKNYMDGSLSENVDDLNNKINNVSAAATSGLLPVGGLQARHFKELSGAVFPTPFSAVSARVLSVTIDGMPPSNEEPQIDLQDDSVNPWWNSNGEVEIPFADGSGNAILHQNSAVFMYPVSDAEVSADNRKRIRLAGIEMSGASFDGSAPTLTLKATGKIPTEPISVVFVIRDDVDTLRTEYYELLSEPDNWSDVCIFYFVTGNDQYEAVTKEGHYLTVTKPYDWDLEDGYKSYYRWDGTNYVQIDDATAPTWGSEPFYTVGTHWCNGVFYELSNQQPASPGFVQFINCVGDYVDKDVLKAGGIGAYFDQQIGNALKEKYE